MKQSKSKHTPGPWILTFDGTGILALSKKGTFIKVAESLTVQLVDGTGDHSLTPEKVAANARLIAAAPELLEALEQFVFWYDQYRPKVSVRSGDDPSGLIENLDFKIERYRQIIAKAKGVRT